MAFLVVSSNSEQEKVAVAAGREEKRPQNPAEAMFEDGLKGD